MDAADKQRLQKLHKKLVENVRVREILPTLMQDGVLGDDDYEVVTRGISEREKMQSLLSILPRKGQGSYRSFRDALGQSYEWLAEELDDQEVIITSQQQDRREQLVTDDMVSLLRSNCLLVRRWQTLAHALEVPDLCVPIQVQANIYMLDLSECVRHLLEQWRSRRGKGATLGVLVDALRKESFNDLADILED